MKFDYCIGNPPYQGNNHYQVYTDFYLAAQQVSNYVDMVFPTGWQEPKDANNLSKLNKKEVKEDRQIVLIDNKHNLFANVPGAEWTNVILWKKGYDNGLDGKQRVLTDGKDEQIVSLKYDKSQIEKPKELVALKDLVLRYGSFVGMDTIVSVRKPYGLSTDFLDNPQKYNLPSVSDERTSDNDISIYGLKARKNVICFAKQDYPIPKVTKAKDKYKVLLGKAWGNFSKGYLGGAYADIIIAFPNEICTENYLECGCFDTYKEALFCGKYLMTKFARALLYLNKFSQDNSKDKWKAVPIQDYHEEWWDKSIAEIDIELMKKYNVPQDIQDFVFKNIQERTEANIVNYK